MSFHKTYDACFQAIGRIYVLRNTWMLTTPMDELLKTYEGVITTHMQSLRDDSGFLDLSSFEMMCGSLKALDIAFETVPMPANSDAEYGVIVTAIQGLLCSIQHNGKSFYYTLLPSETEFLLTGHIITVDGKREFATAQMLVASLQHLLYDYGYLSAPVIP